jgi:hypothetical protein
MHDTIDKFYPKTANGTDQSLPRQYRLFSTTRIPIDYRYPRWKTSANQV